MPARLLSPLYNDSMAEGIPTTFENRTPEKDSIFLFGKNTGYLLYIRCLMTYKFAQQYTH